jgi:hypothetical protein
MKKKIAALMVLAGVFIMGCSSPTEPYDPKTDYGKFDRTVFCYGKVIIPVCGGIAAAGGEVTARCDKCNLNIGITSATIGEDGHYELTAVNALKHAGHKGSVDAYYQNEEGYWYSARVDYPAFPASPFNVDFFLEPN